MCHCLRVLPLAQRSVTAIRGVAFSTSFLSNSAKVQEGFEGLQAGLVFDHKHGFGYTKDGKVVIVSPQDCINITTPSGIEDDETESILEMAKETYHERKSSKGAAGHGPQNN